MNNDKIEDWNLIKAFLQVAESGSLSSAAVLLGLSQPTVSRQISQLEVESGLNLFKRTSQGLLLTESGEDLVETARKAQSSINGFQRKLLGQTENLAGDVRISVNDVVGTFMLPPALAAFRLLYPQIQIEIVISNKATSLNKRDADVALRMFRPTQPDLVARRLPNLKLGFFAHESYLARFGTPDKPEDIFNHCIIGFDQDMSFIEGAQALGFNLSKKNFQFRTDDLTVQINLLRAGAGITGTHTGLVEQIPGIVGVLPMIPIPDLEFWAVCHHDVQYNARIKVFMEFLVEWFKDDPYKNCIS